MDEPLQPNVLEVGTSGRGEVVINHPQMLVDENGCGFLVFSVEQAHRFAATVRKMADRAREELQGDGI